MKLDNAFSMNVECPSRLSAYVSRYAVSASVSIETKLEARSMMISGTGSTGIWTRWDWR